MKRNLVERIIASSMTLNPSSVDAVNAGLGNDLDILLGHNQQKEQDKRQQEKVKIEFERPSVVRHPGPCPVCDGKGGWEIRSRYDERVVSKVVCKYCGGCGRIPRT